MSTDHSDRDGMFALVFSIGFVFLFMLYIVFVQPGVKIDANVKEPAAAAAPAAEVAK